MNVQIIGAGAVGMLTASYLSLAGDDVTLVVRNTAQCKAINTHGLKLFDEQSKQRVIQMRAALTLQHNVDLTFVAVKAQQIEQVLPQLLMLPKGATIVFMQNGLSHYTYKDVLKSYRVVFASVQFGAQTINAHTVKHNGVGTLKIGVDEEFSSLCVLQQRSCEKFPIEIVGEPYVMLFEKALLNCLINPLTAVLGILNGELIRNQAAYKLLRTLYAEIVEAFPEQNEKLHFSEVALLCEQTGQNVSSMLADIRAGRQTEIDAIVKPVIETAEKDGKKLPTLTLLYHLVKAIDEERGFV